MHIFNLSIVIQKCILISELDSSFRFNLFSCAVPPIVVYVARCIRDLVSLLKMDTIWKETVGS